MSLRRRVFIDIIFLLLQVVCGEFVPGLTAGLIHNHWPLMSDGQWLHDSVLLEKDSWLLRLTEGKSGVQFVHRTLAYVVVGLMALLYYKAQKFTLSTQQKTGLNALVLIVVMQFTLGVLTLLYSVPLWLGLIHQIVAFFLLATMTYTLHRLSK